MTSGIDQPNPVIASLRVLKRAVKNSLQCFWKGIIYYLLEVKLKTSASLTNIEAIRVLKDIEIVVAIEK